MAHLKGIGIRNFRIFEKETYFDFRKINILTGPNNSGKSSLLKFLLLLKANNLGRLDTTIGIHNLGEIDSLINFNSNEKSIGLSYFCDIEEINKRYKIEFTYQTHHHHILICSDLRIKDMEDDKYFFSWSNKKLNFDKLYEIFISLRQDLINNNGFFTYLNEHDPNQGINMDELINYDTENTIFKYDESLKVNSIEDEFAFLNEHFNFPDEKTLHMNMYVMDYQQKPYMWLELLNKLHRYYFVKHQEKMRWRNYRFFLQGNEDKIEMYPFLYNVHERKIESTTNSDFFFHLMSTFFYKLWRDIENFERFFRSSPFDNLSSLNSPHVRAYITSNNTDILTNLLKDFVDSKRGLNITKDFFDKWMKVFGIGDSLEFESLEGILLFPYIFKNKRKINLSDLGYGYSQLITIFLKILNVIVSSWHGYVNNDDYDDEFDNGQREPPALYIEEPEANLHPAFQSKLADMFIETSEKFNIQFFIETHSEYLIRKLQYLTAKKEIKPEDSVIYYFNHPDEVAKGAEQVKELHIREDGMMDGDFGPGFFDESTRLTVDLLKLQNKN